MKTNKSGLNWFALVTGTLVWCAVNLQGQSGPTITTQPSSQTIVAGTSVNFSVAVDGTGPFSYQWQFNGTNYPAIIRTVAGGGSGGDGGAATNASLNPPCGVAADVTGNLYVGDVSMFARVRKIDTNGIITTVAGNGNWPNPDVADGSQATNGALGTPGFVTLDSAGNLYISEASWGRVRKVDTNGVITTVAGNCYWGYSGDGGPATNANLFVETGPPCGLALDTRGNLYIADAGNSRVRKVDTNGIITTVAGNGTSSYSGDGGAATNAGMSPVGLAFDLGGNIYISDPSNRNIRKVDTNGIITTVAGGGSGGLGGAATNASLHSPIGVATDVVGNLYISDEYDNRVCKVDARGIITTVAGTGGDTGYFAGDGGAATNASLWCPYGLAVDAKGNLFIADHYNTRIREVVLAGNPIFSLTSVNTNNAGQFSVVITGPGGSVTSAVATLTVMLPPSILVQPTNQGVVAGSNATLTVTAAGDPPLFYSWHFNATNLVQSGTNASLLVTNISVANLGQYTVVVTNAYGSTTSEVANLAFPPSLTAQPTSLAVLPGANATFEVMLDGVGPFTYQWQFNGNNLPNNMIATVAGNGRGTYAGDGGTATNASLNTPSGVALDAKGNLYIADTANNRIRRMDTSGIIATVAGGGSGGDGGAATNASLNGPSGVALDAFGNLYIADTENCRIRKLDTNGIITTVAGNGDLSYSGDGGAATNASLYYPSGVALDTIGSLYIADSRHNRIRKVDTNGIIMSVAGNGTFAYSGDGGNATNASLSWPYGVAFDSSGKLYIADTENCRIRKVDTYGTIATVAGNGAFGYSGDGGMAAYARLGVPDGLAFDAWGNLYIADASNNRIRKVDTNGIITTVVGTGGGTYAGDGGAPTNASLNGPSNVAMDSAGNLYIADAANNRIRKVFAPGHATLALANINANNAGNYTVVITSPYGSITSAVATLTVEAPPIITAQPASQTAMAGSSPVFSVTVAGSGPFAYSWYFSNTNLLQSGTNASFATTNISAANAGQYTVVVTNTYGSVTSQVATLTILFPPSVTAQPASQSALPGANMSFSVTADGTGPFSYQWRFNGTNLNNSIMTTVAGNGSGTYAGDGAAATNASLKGPTSVAVDSPGNLYIADAYNYRIRIVGTNGIINTIAGNGNGAYSGDGGAATNASLWYPCGIILDKVGAVYIAEQSNRRIRRIGTNGIITTAAGNGSTGFSGDGVAATNTSLYYPRGVAFDAASTLYIADTDNNRIRAVGTNGIITTVAGNGTRGYSGDGGAATEAGLYYPSSVALDAWGTLYIADTSNNRIRKVGTNGIIVTVAGNGSASYSGDGGAATNASLKGPLGVTFDARGYLYIADTGNNRIRKVGTNGIITTVAGNGSGTYAGDGGSPTNASLYGPAGVTVDSAGNLYIADASNNRIRKVSPPGYSTLTIANASYNNIGDYTVVITSPYGSVTSAVATLTLQAPPLITVQPASQTAGVGSSPVFSVAIAGSGPFGYSWFLENTNLVQSGTNSTLSLYGVSTNDGGHYTVMVTNAYGSVTSQVATLTIAFPPSVTIQPASQTNRLGSNVTFIVTVDGTSPLSYQWQFNGTNLPSNIISTVAGNGNGTYAGDGSTATNASLYRPGSAVFDGSGNLYIADTYNNRVRKVDTNRIITTVAGKTSSGFSGDGGAATNANLYNPFDVALDTTGNLYFADYRNNRVRRVDPNGTITTVAGTGSPGYSGDGGAATNANLFSPLGVALDATGNLYIADSRNNRVRKVDTNGLITTVAGTNSPGYSGDGGPAASANLNNPQGVALDAMGKLYIGDASNNRIRRVDPYGIITTVAGTGSSGYSGDGGAVTNANLSNPQGVALDAMGNLYVADASNNRIRRVDTSGIIATVAGGGGGGDGGAATSARLIAPHSVALDGAGNLYIADSGNHRIRKVPPSTTNPTLELFNIQVADAGNYSVVITNAWGSLTSSVATLAIAAPPSITNRLSNLTVFSGGDTCFTVSASGSGPLSYQWQFNGTNLAGATTSVLSLTNTPTGSAGVYNVLITGPGGVTSATALLTVGTVLGVSQNADQMILNWTGPWALQSATNVQGPYADILGAASPFTNLIWNAPEQFFRLRSTATSAVTAIGFSSGGFLVGASGAPGYNYAVETSTNLTTWTAIQTNPVPFQFIDVNASNHPVRFYRTVLVK
jgi:sugar lactone lactonase YvrE